jgi:hypothetical protein
MNGRTTFGNIEVFKLKLFNTVKKPRLIFFGFDVKINYENTSMKPVNLKKRLYNSEIN